MANDFSARQPRRKYCQFCKENTEFIDYKDTQLLRKYMTDRGKIKPRRVTGACTQHQHDIANAIKRGIVFLFLAFLLSPYGLQAAAGSLLWALDGGKSALYRFLAS